MYGDLLFDITGSDPPGPDRFPAGSQVLIRGATGPDGRNALCAFTSNEQIGRWHPPATRTMSLGTSAIGALQFARDRGDAWLYIDPAGPTCALSAPEIDFALRNPNNAALKSVLADVDAGRASGADVLMVLAQDGPLLFGADESSVAGEATFRMVRLPDGGPGLACFTSAPEVVAFTESDAVAASSVREILRILRERGLGGLVINPAGPSAYFPVDMLSGLSA